jgi:hypothetical protein
LAKGRSLICSVLRLPLTRCFSFQSSGAYTIRSLT